MYDLPWHKNIKKYLLWSWYNKEFLQFWIKMHLYTDILKMKQAFQNQINKKFINVKLHYKENQTYMRKIFVGFKYLWRQHNHVIWGSYVFWMSDCYIIFDSCVLSFIVFIDDLIRNQINKTTCKQNHTKPR